MVKKTGARIEHWRENDSDDPRARYGNRQCTMDFYMENYHDYSELTEFDSLQDFLRPYERSGFVKDEEEVFVRQREGINRTLWNQCERCGCSAQRAPQGENCEYEENFFRQWEVELILDSSKMVCQECKMPFYGKPEKTDSRPMIQDVRLMGRPTELSILRKKLKCPNCHKRIKVEAIPGVQSKARAKLTDRLLRALAEERCKGVKVRLSAQGYGLEERTVRKHKEKLIGSVKKKRDKQDAGEIKAENKVSTLKKQKETELAFAKTEAVVGGEAYTLCFSYDPTSCSPEQTLSLRAAYGREEKAFLEHWPEGKFDLQMPAGLSDDELTRLAYYFTAAEYPDVPHALSYLATELMVAYVKAMSRKKNPMGISPMELGISWCLLAARGEETVGWEDFDYDVYRSLEYLLWEIMEWAEIVKEQKILRAARKLLNYVVYAKEELIVFFKAGACNRKPEYPPEVIRELGEVAGLFERVGSHGNMTPREILAEIFYLNPAVIPLVIREESSASFPITEDGQLDLRYFSGKGIPVHCLKHLFSQGLFREEHQGSVWCSPQRYRHQGEHPCDGHECPWIFLDEPS